MCEKLAKWSIFVAIALHLISAGTLYLLAFLGISTVGYITSVAALLLTFLRPAILWLSIFSHKIKHYS